MSEKTVKILGIGIFIAGMGLSFFGNMISNKERDQLIAKKVQEAIADLKTRES